MAIRILLSALKSKGCYIDITVLNETAGATASPGEHSAMSEDLFRCQLWAGVGALASSTRSPGQLFTDPAKHRWAGNRESPGPKVNSAEATKHPVLNRARHFQKQKDIWKCSFQLSFDMDANPFVKP